MFEIHWYKNKKVGNTTTLSYAFNTDMMKKIGKILSVFALISMLALPLVASAQPIVPGNQPQGFAQNFFGCGSNPTVTCIVSGVIQFLLAIVFIISVVFLIIGGFRYIVSQGNEEGVEKAKGTITNAIIGIVIVLLAWIILRVVVNVLQNGSAQVV